MQGCSATQVVVCYNQIRFQEEVNMVLAHELIHAYDHCRAKNVDWHNCEHHACSEVCWGEYWHAWKGWITISALSCSGKLSQPGLLGDRCTLLLLWATDRRHCMQVRAANLSGDCQFGHEWNRGNFGLKGQHQTCVRRRAQLSVAMNPNCKGIRAKAAVDAAFPPCFEDTSPFDRIP